ncbi:hypothetical protein SELMODRAFT_271653 [Selaginella moellendorffii]|uniref:MSP domain-containing protein n=1 Tax=Selaginella moellendorffii TaxID=88036 RepID=D8SK45_SELML|nr:vesicle-associated protein 1-2 isoform X2 [Selaginella moellendorffii]XP_002990544.1 vesicle-associated protein 1-2 isoform X2 [Selaginella moellendorffii]EFJ08421.1 hypothetical protein SELMODRAFT_272137 [Selaginella moellendorffii]EFJ15162.1 hypothetical protein SELMODRAFT_271653 [Selaginella moellendorffii]|eukprot:XP_002983666.1 vesicle-associated protein 1-2 isoform X2 [Selaginella moellendorffii]
MPSELLSFQPTELKFPFELKKQIACPLELKNNTDEYVAFKVKTTSPKKYSVRPNAGFVPPHGSVDIIITMQAQRDYPPDLQQCKDKFLVQSVRAPEGAQFQEVSQELFNKENGAEVFENKLKVVYVSPPQPPSPVPESAEETVSPSKADNGDWIFSLRDGPKTAGELESKIAEARASLTTLSNERDLAKHQTRELEQELANAKVSSNHTTTSRGHGYSLFFVFFVGILGVLVGYFLRH